MYTFGRSQRCIMADVSMEDYSTFMKFMDPKKEYKISKIHHDNVDGYSITLSLKSILYSMEVRPELPKEHSVPILLPYIG